jgi:hypothetical protein
MVVCYPIYVYIGEGLDSLGCIFLAFVTVSSVSFVCISSSESRESSSYLFWVLQRKGFPSVVVSVVSLELFLFCTCCQV